MSAETSGVGRQHQIKQRVLATTTNKISNKSAVYRHELVLPTLLLVCWRMRAMGLPLVGTAS